VLPRRELLGGACLCHASVPAVRTQSPSLRKTTKCYSFMFKFDFTIADLWLILIMLDLVAIFIKHQIGWPNVLNFPPIKMDVLKGSEPSINKYIKK
jgi:hypothetical protein